MTRSFRILMALTALLTPSASPSIAQPTADSQSVRVYVGTYTQPNRSEGIYLFELDLASGRLTPRDLAGKAENPSFLAIHPNRKVLYAAEEIESGAISAFSIDPASGKLALVNKQPSGGATPCFVTVDRSGKAVLVANYGGGSVASLPLADDGALREPAAVIRHTGSSVNAERQKEPHAHSINLDTANRFAFAADLGIDKLLVYRFDPATAALAPHDPPSVALAPGAGPRHFAFHPGGKLAYAINELTSTVTTFAYDADAGRLRELQTISTLPGGVKAKNITAEVQVHPSGKFLYGSNRGHDSIAVFAIDQASGKLTPIGHQSTQGKTPRNFGIDPSGTYLIAANQDSDSLVVFKIDAASGALSATGVTVPCFSPVCVKFLPAS